MLTGFESRSRAGPLLAGCWTATRPLCIWVKVAFLLLLLWCVQNWRLGSAAKSGNVVPYSKSAARPVRSAHSPQLGEGRGNSSQEVEMLVRKEARRGRAKVVIVRHRLSPVLHVLFFWSWLLSYLSIVDRPRPANSLVVWICLSGAYFLSRWGRVLMVVFVVSA